MNPEDLERVMRNMMREFAAHSPRTFSLRVKGSELREIYRARVDELLSSVGRYEEQVNKLCAALETSDGGTYENSARVRQIRQHFTTWRADTARIVEQLDFWAEHIDAGAEYVLSPYDVQSLFQLGREAHMQAPDLEYVGTVARPL